MNIQKLWAKVAKPKPIMLTPFEATHYQQGYLWGQLGFNPTDVHIDYDDNKPFLQGWTDAVNNLPATFDKSFGTPALYRGGA